MTSSLLNSLQVWFKKMIDESGKLAAFNVDFDLHWHIQTTIYILVNNRKKVAHFLN